MKIIKEVMKVKQSAQCLTELVPGKLHLLLFLILFLLLKDAGTKQPEGTNYEFASIWPSHPSGVLHMAGKNTGSGSRLSGFASRSYHFLAV